MAKGSARRSRVVKAMVAFVAVLALLTFFSNTIMNLTIPKVLGAYASRGNLSYSNSARGNITVDNQTEVKGLDGRVVEEVLVSNYDSVQKGDKILTLKSVEESEDLQAKKTRLKELEREKKYEARQPKDTTDYGMYQDAINTAKTALSDAKAMQKKVKNKASTVKKNNKIISDQSKKAVSYEFVVYHGIKPKEELLLHLRGSDIFVMPSIHESFGLVYAEAMTQGVPVVYSRGQGFDGQYKEGEVGYSVDCFDAQEIADRMIDILNDYRNISNQCIENSKRYSWEKIAKRYKEIYDQSLLIA